VRPKGGKKDKYKNNAYFCYVVGICHIWIRRRALQSAAEKDRLQGSLYNVEGDRKCFMSYTIWVSKQLGMEI
jgi:hypothetical protein